MNSFVSILEGLKPAVISRPDTESQDDHVSSVLQAGNIVFFSKVLKPATEHIKITENYTQQKRYITSYEILCFRFFAIFQFKNSFYHPRCPLCALWFMLF